MGTKLSYEFNTYIVRDAKEKKLLKSENPFALAVLAAKYLNESRGNADLRYRYKLKLIRLAKKRNYTDEQIVRLLKFIDYLLILPDELEQKFEQDIEDIYLKSDDMKTLKSDKFADMLCQAMYGETIKEKARRESLGDRLYAAEQLLIETNLSVESIASILKLSKEMVLAIQIRLASND